jgi:hypothetical protein
MQDGGMKLSDIKKLVDPERYIQLLGRFLRKGEEEFSQPKYKKGGN